MTTGSAPLDIRAARPRRGGSVNSAPATTPGVNTSAALMRRSDWPVETRGFWIPFFIPWWTKMELELETTKPNDSDTWIKSEWFENATQIQANKMYKIMTYNYNWHIIFKGTCFISNRQACHGARWERSYWPARRMKPPGAGIVETWIKRWMCRLKRSSNEGYLEITKLEKKWDLDLLFFWGLVDKKNNIYIYYTNICI